MALSHTAIPLPAAPPPRPSKVETAALHLRNAGRDTARRIVAGAIGNALSRNDLARLWGEIDEYPALARAVADFRRGAAPDTGAAA